MGIFDGQIDQLFAHYAVKLQFRDKIAGGIPLDPKIIEGWLAAKAGIDTREEVMQATRRTLIELGKEIPESATYEELQEAIAGIAGMKNTCGFKYNKDGGLYLESRVIKAMLKEVTNILYAGERWGKTKKGPKSFLAERVFVNPGNIYFGKHEPDSVELFIGHVTGPMGRSSNLTYYQCMVRPVIEFTVLVLKNEVEASNWPEMWMLSQENGIGALRSQGYGTFDILRFDKLKSTSDEIKRIVSAPRPDYEAQLSGVERVEFVRELEAVGS